VTYKASDGQQGESGGGGSGRSVGWVLGGRTASTGPSGRVERARPWRQYVIMRSKRVAEQHDYVILAMCGKHFYLGKISPIVQF